MSDVTLDDIRRAVRKLRNLSLLNIATRLALQEALNRCERLEAAEEELRGLRKIIEASVDEVEP